MKTQVDMQAISPDAAVGPQLRKLLRARIISCELPPGARVSETEFASAYHVSRQPVREAFIKLAEEGLVEIRPQRGTFVTRISVQAVHTARFIREAVEADIVRRVAETATPETLAELDALIATQRQTMGTASATAFMEMDDDFHHHLARCAGQEAVWKYLEGLKSQMNRVRHFSAQQFSTGKLVTQHAAVVDAIRRGDVGGAETAIRKHLREINLDLPDIVRASPSFFEDQEAIQ